MTRVKQGPAPDLSGQLHSGRKKEEGRPANQSTPALSRRARDGGQASSSAWDQGPGSESKSTSMCASPLSVPQLPCVPAPQLALHPHISENQGECPAWAHMVIPCRPEPLMWCPEGSRHPRGTRNGERGGKYGHLTWAFHRLTHTCTRLDT